MQDKFLKNIFYIAYCLTFLFLLNACNSGKKKEVVTEPPAVVVISPEAGNISNRVTKNNSNYSFYIPKSYTGKEKYPVLILIDPHAKGSFAVGLYKDLAERFQFILICSNDSKNGMSIDQSSGYINDLLNEAKTILPGNVNEISVAGFSGGAKVAIVSGNLIPGFNCITYCGAALPPGSIKNTVPMLGIAGTYDMNFSEVINYNASLSSQNISHVLIEWNGKHEWPDSSTFTNVFYWNLFTSMRKTEGEKNQALIDEFKKMVESKFESEKSPLSKNILLSEEIEMLKGLTDVSGVKKKQTSLISSGEFKEAKKKNDKILALEDQAKNEFVSAFENREMAWWTNKVTSLKSDSGNSSNLRLLGYISLAAYSYSSKSVTANNVPFAKKALEIYKLADPTNSEQPFLSACLYSKNGMQDSAIYFLKEATNLGLDDRSKIENEKDLSPLHGRNDYSELISKLK